MDRFLSKKSTASKKKTPSLHSIRISLTSFTNSLPSKMEHVHEKCCRQKPNLWKKKILKNHNDGDDMAMDC